MLSAIDRFVRKKISEANAASPAEQGRRYGIILLIVVPLALLVLFVLLVLFTAAVNAIFGSIT